MTDVKKVNCICKKVECEFHGKCKECIEKHAKQGNKPHCMREKQK